MSIAAQLRKHVELQQFYDFLWSFPYLEPEYSLKLDGKDLSHLSPGERGTPNQVVYTMGSIESPQINKYLVDVLEGTRPAFDNRGSKYYAS
jgi:hypothetical protein